MTSATTAIYQRAEWIGENRLWPRHTLVNAGGWTACQNREYQAAFDAQEAAIVRAIELETVAQRESRLHYSCGACAPRPDDDVFDQYFPIAEIEGAIKFKEGVVMAFHNSRDCMDSMLDEAIQDIKELKLEHAKLIEEFWVQYPQHLSRHNKHVFIKGSPPEDTVAGDSPSSAKRARTKDSRNVIATETPEYWLKDRNLSSGMERISHKA